MLAENRMYGNSEDIYRLLISLKQEIKEMGILLRALRNEMKGEDTYGNNKQRHTYEENS